MEGALLPHRQTVFRNLGGILERGQLGLLGISPGPPLPELPHAQRLRDLGSPGTQEEPT